MSNTNGWEARDPQYEQNYTGIYQKLKNTAAPKYIRKLAGAIGIEPYIDVLFYSPLRSVGWFDCYNAAPVDQFGEPIPWMPFAAIDFLSDRITNDLRVFEYGSGNSTRWWSSQVAEVVCVEDNKHWYDKVSATLPPNAEIQHKTGDAYVGQISEYGPFDLISVDGSKRVECAKRAPEFLTDEGVIVFDDTYDESFQDGISYLKQNGFKEIFFQSMGPVTSNLQRTSIFYRDNNCLKI